MDDHSNKLNPDQMVQLDILLLNTPNQLYARYGAIDGADTSEENYPRFRELVLTERNEDALVALARFKKQEDIPLILNFPIEDEYFYTYRAIAEFPATEFLSLLETNLYLTLNETHYSNEWRELYRAIAAYTNEHAVSLLEIPVLQAGHKHTREYRLKYVHDAIRNYKIPIYDELRWKLWDAENIISLEDFYYLRNRDEARAWELTRKSLYNVNRLHSHEILVAAMLDWALATDADFAYEIIRMHLIDSTVHLYDVFADKAMEIQDPSFIQPMFTNLENETNPNVYLESAGALLSYDDHDIYERMVATLRLNPALTNDWGGEALAEMLSRHAPNPPSE